LYLIYDTAALQDDIDATVAQGVVIISDTKCPFCAKAKALLSSLGTAYQVQIFHTLVQRFNKNPGTNIQFLSYQAVELDRRDDGNAWRVELAARTSCPTLPQVRRRIYAI
jgi:predicted DsbA family dithiol-disulfide isomerase